MSSLGPSQSFDPTTPKFLFVISLRYPLNFAKISLNFNPKRMQKLSGEHRRYTVTLIGLTHLLDFNLSYMALVIAQHNSRLDLEHRGASMRRWQDAERLGQ